MLDDALIPELISLIGSADGLDDLGILLEGLLTPREIREIVFRWRLISRLLEGVPQRDIASELGVSLGKISRGSRLLQYGPPEFRELIERIREKQARSCE